MLLTSMAGSLAIVIGVIPRDVLNEASEDPVSTVVFRSDNAFACTSGLHDAC